MRRCVALPPCHQAPRRPAGEQESRMHGHVGRLHRSQKLAEGDVRLPLAAGQYRGAVYAWALRERCPRGHKAGLGAPRTWKACRVRTVRASVVEAVHAGAVEELHG